MNRKSSEGEEKMTTDPRMTREQEACWGLVDEISLKLSEAAQIVFDEAQSAAYVWNINFMYASPEEYEEAMDNMRQAAVDLPERDCELLGKLWRAALGAAASIDPNDRTPARHNVDMGAVHRYYRMTSSMIEQILEELAEEKRRKARE